MAQRVTLRKRKSYNTTSNRRRIVKTPGGKLVYHHIKKLATSPKCGDCGNALSGVRPSCCCVTRHSYFSLFYRSLRFDRVNTQLSPSARRPFAEHTVEADAANALGSGMSGQNAPCIIRLINTQNQNRPCILGGGGEDREESDQVTDEAWKEINILPSSPSTDSYLHYGPKSIRLCAATFSRSYHIMMYTSMH
jgi:hypothetical protein